MLRLVRQSSVAIMRRCNESISIVDGDLPGPRGCPTPSSNAWNTQLHPLVATVAAGVSRAIIASAENTAVPKSRLQVLASADAAVITTLRLVHPQKATRFMMPEFDITCGTSQFSSRPSVMQYRWSSSTHLGPYDLSIDRLGSGGGRLDQVSHLDDCRVTRDRLRRRRANRALSGQAKGLSGGSGHDTVRTRALSPRNASDTLAKTFLATRETQVLNVQISDVQSPPG